MIERCSSRQPRCSASVVLVAALLVDRAQEQATEKADAKKLVSAAHAAGVARA